MPQAVPSRSLRGLEPGGPITGRLSVPGSKSIAQRALLLSAVRAGETTLGGFSYGEDVRGAFEVARLLGASIERTPGGSLVVRGRAPGARAFPLGRTPLDAGESGTLARLCTALCALADRPGAQAVVQVRGTMRTRTSEPLFEALRQAGAGVVAPRAGCWPVTIRATAPPDRVTLVRPLSSQEVSSLLVALATRGGAHVVHVAGEIPSRPYVDMSIALLRAFGADVGEEERLSVRREFSVQGPLRSGRFAYKIEPDVSAAAVGLVAGCLTGGRVLVPGVPIRSLQGDARIVEHLASFGCEAQLDDAGLWAEGAPTRGADLDLSGEPDLAPVLAVVAAAAAARVGGASVISGLGTLPGKESQRLEVLERGLSRCGFRVETSGEMLRFFPGHEPPTAVQQLDPAGDHRMAFAFALLGLLVPGVRVSNPRCVAKSWPSFWEDLAASGASVVEG